MVAVLRWVIRKGFSWMPVELRPAGRGTGLVLVAGGEPAGRIFLQGGPREN